LELVGGAGRDEEHGVFRCKKVLPAPGDVQALFNHPQQLPLRVKVGRSVVYGVEKYVDTGDFRIMDEFIFAHAGSPPQSGLL
jgi:hypothetical protein